MAVHNNLLLVSLSLLLLLSAILETEAHSEGPETTYQKDQCGMYCTSCSRQQLGGVDTSIDVVKQEAQL